MRGEWGGEDGRLASSDRVEATDEGMEGVQPLPPMTAAALAMSARGCDCIESRGSRQTIQNPVWGALLGGGGGEVGEEGRGAVGSGGREPDR